jgi:hypothetical protein
MRPGDAMYLGRGLFATQCSHHTTLAPQKSNDVCLALEERPPVDAWLNVLALSGRTFCQHIRVDTGNQDEVDPVKEAFHLSGIAYAA